MATTPPTPPAIRKPPYYLHVSECEGVYNGEQHYAIFADECRGIIADLEGGLSPETKAVGEFIVNACNNLDKLIQALKDALVALDFAAKRDPEQAGVYHCTIAREALTQAE